MRYAGISSSIDGSRRLYATGPVPRQKILRALSIAAQSFAPFRKAQQARALDKTDCEYTRVPESSSSGERGLTLRSRRGPTARHQARAGGTEYIFTGPGLASCRRSRLNANVMSRRRYLPLFKMQLLRFASAKHQPRLLPPNAGLLSPVWRQAALAIPHRFVFGHLQRVKPTCGTVRCAWRATATFISSATNRAGVA